MNMRSRLHVDGRAALALFCLLAVTYLYTFPRWADPNQNSRLDMVFAVADQGTFQIDRYVANTVDYARVGDHYYSDKAPGAAFLGIPVYAALRGLLDLPAARRLADGLAGGAAFQSTLRPGGSGVLDWKLRFALTQVVLTALLAALPSALIGVLLYRLLGRLGVAAWARAAAVVAYGLLTPVLAYAGSFYGHQLSAALLLGAFYLLFTARQRLLAGRLFAVGLLLGYAVVTEYPAALGAASLSLYALGRLWKPRRAPHVIWLVLGGLVVALPWMAYNTAVFGGPLALGYSNSELWLAEHHTGFMSLTWPHAAALWGITFGLFRGLFVLSPVLLLALPGFGLWWRSGRHRAEWWVALSSSLAFFLFNASSVMWWGGFAVGPRYLLPGLPFLALPLGFELDAWGHRSGFRVLAGVLAAWSLVATWGLTLAGQAFPSDTLRNPLLEYAWPNWAAGNIARNVGSVLGLRGAASLLPLAVALALILALIGWLARAPAAVQPSPAAIPPRLPQSAD
jgi:hypothetical protein